MLSSVEKLADIAHKPKRKIIGLMSGTSLDGLDIALCDVAGVGQATELSILEFTTRAYSQTIKDEIRHVFAKPQVDFQALCLLNESLGTLHGEWVREALQAWQIEPEAIDLVASHGQTVFHAPRSFHVLADKPNATLQIGDGDHVARASGIITLCDFRQRHIAAGGEGAPLVVYGDQLLFSSPQSARVLLNIGGIANFTYLPKQPASDAAFCSDIGPGNTLLDAYCQRHFQQEFDEGGRLAMQGKVNSTLLKALKATPFLALPLPKTTGPELFNLQFLQAALDKCKTDISALDVLTTLTHFTADTIADALAAFSSAEMYVSGGGAFNPLLMQLLHDKLPNNQLHKTDVLGVKAEAKEAALFAVLANECIAASATQAIHGMPSTSMGKICFPE